MPPPFDPSGSFYPQDTYLGRTRNFFRLFDPRTLLITDAELEEANRVLEEFSAWRRSGATARPVHLTDAKLWEAKRMRDAVYHPQTNEKIPIYGRWSAFVPLNIPITLGMNNAATLGGQVFWQWVNQTYNVVANYSNRNASKPMTNEGILTAYAGAVLTSVSIIMGARRLLSSPRISDAMLRRLSFFVPYTAVAAAGASNLILTRKGEMDNGIAVESEDGELLGISKKAGQRAVMLSALTRVALPAPVILGPRIVRAVVERYQLVKSPRAVHAIDFGATFFCLWAALPFAMALSPQRVAMKVQELEPEFHSLRGKDGKPLEQVFINKGL